MYYEGYIHYFWCSSRSNFNKNVDWKISFFSRDRINRQRDVICCRRVAQDSKPVARLAFLWLGNSLLPCLPREIDTGYAAQLFISCGACNLKHNTKAHVASCHCGSVQFKVRLTDEFNTIRRCSCSYCSKRGAIAVSAQLDGIEFVAGKEMLTHYEFNTKTAKHYFCSKCGIYTHHQRRSNPNQFGKNVACLEGISPFDFSEVVVYDGVNHPSDLSSGPLIAGVLRFSKD
jgi:hypothetical protein